jgi:hypothetical protein
VIGDRGNHAFDLFCLPPDPDSFIPNARLRTATAAAKSAAKGSADINRMAASLVLVNGRGPRLFRKAKATETHALRPNLDQIMQLLRLPDTSILSEQTLGNLVKQVGGFKLATRTSWPEPVLAWYNFILFASEAKGVTKGCFECLPQGCQIAGDAAILLARAGLAVEECVVPGVLVFGDSLQFFAAYLVPPKYPTFCLLSQPISMTSRQGQMVAAAWLCTLRSLCEDTRKLLATAPEVRKSLEDGLACPHPPMDDPDAQLPHLWVENTFLKPVRLRLWSEQKSDDPELAPFRLAMSRVLEIFACLHNHQACHRFINFPIGWLQMPTKKEQKHLREALEGRLEQDGFGDTADFQPYLVFARLQWHPEPPRRPSVHVQMYKDGLKEALSGFAAAGVVMMDLRPKNVMWVCSCDPEDPTSQHGFQLKVVDWEDARMEGELILGAWLDAYKEDRRYPLYYIDNGTTEIPARAWMDQWCMRYINEFLDSDCRNHSQFMATLDVEQLRAALIAPGGAVQDIPSLGFEVSTSSSSSSSSSFSPVHAQDPNGAPSSSLALDLVASQEVVQRRAKRSGPATVRESSKKIKTGVEVDGTPGATKSLLRDDPEAEDNGEEAVRPSVDEEANDGQVTVADVMVARPLFL